MMLLEISDLYYKLSNRNLHLRRPPLIIHAEKRVRARGGGEEDASGGRAATKLLSGVLQPHRSACPALPV